MTLLEFSANKPTDDPSAISTACRFDETGGMCTFAEQENPNPLRLTTTAPLNTSMNNNTDHNSRLFNDISPSNPAILLARPTTATDTRPFVCSAVTIVSSARTMELYISGEYVGTFRGESFLLSSSFFTPIAGAAGASPPLFLIQIDQQSLLHRCRNLLFKFFIPKKPVAFQDSLSIHWLIVEGALPPSPHQESTSQASPHLAPSSSTQAPTASPSPSPLVSSTPQPHQQQTPPTLSQLDATTTDTNGTPKPRTTDTTLVDSTTPTSHLNHTSSPSNLSAFASPQSYASFAGAVSLSPATSINLEKVRQMLSQVQIDNLPQGAKDLMWTMEVNSFALAQHSQLQQQRSPSAGHLLPSPLTSPLPPLSYASTPSPSPTPVAASTPPSATTATATATTAQTATTATETPVATEAKTSFVTRAELTLMEERIMAKMGQRFQEMEDRILNKLLAAKQTTSWN